MINIILWIIFGALVGWIASMLMGTNEEQGGFANIVVGIVGAVIGGFIARAFGGEGITGFNLTSFVIALLGAIILLGVVNLFSRS
ncbi:MAG TPA: GlsB/YeaQ/YmgE family stress response membrane protein [Candidatus Saccharimonadales bacterium]|nr:GlsB/YeaQ/YmgE family stress response membrane protein [Candidatus Saccharimonadales bacterium]